MYEERGSYEHRHALPSLEMAGDALWNFTSLAVGFAPFVIGVVLGWLADERERKRLDAEIANGWQIDQTVTLTALLPEDRARFALSPDATYRSTSSSGGVVPGGEAFDDASPRLSEWAVWVTGPLLDASECAAWVARANGGLETGDFIFKTGRRGFERMATGLRRLSRCAFEAAHWVPVFDRRPDPVASRPRPHRPRVQHVAHRRPGLCRAHRDAAHRARPRAHAAQRRPAV
jgi:hypothetical protein